MVVHASECVYSNDYSFSFPSEFARWCVCLINGFVRPAVPLFLMASAYLLIPLRSDTGTFFHKRLSRVVIPFILWRLLYSVLPVLWGEYSIADVKSNLMQVAINFIPRASHLWFIYMLLGNPFSLFYYVSGYVGYVLLAHYIRTYLDWDLKKTLLIALPMFLVGYGICIYSFYTRSFTVDAVSSLELAWQTTSFAPVLMSFGAFMLIKQINHTGARLFKVVNNISGASYGMYLMHMLILPYIFVVINPIASTPITIFITAILTYATTYFITKLLSTLPGGKYIIG